MTHSNSFQNNKPSLLTWVTTRRPVVRPLETPLCAMTDGLVTVGEKTQRRKGCHLAAASTASVPTPVRAHGLGQRKSPQSCLGTPRQGTGLPVVLNVMGGRVAKLENVDGFRASGDLAHKSSHRGRGDGDIRAPAWPLPRAAVASWGATQAFSAKCRWDGHDTVVASGRVIARKGLAEKRRSRWGCWTTASRRATGPEGQGGTALPWPAAPRERSWLEAAPGCCPTWSLSPEGRWEVAHSRGYTLTEGGEAGWLGAGGLPSLRQLPGQNGGLHVVQ